MSRYNPYIVTLFVIAVIASIGATILIYVLPVVLYVLTNNGWFIFLYVPLIGFPVLLHKAEKWESNNRGSK